MSLLIKVVDIFSRIVSFGDHERGSNCGLAASLKVCCPKLLQNLWNKSLNLNFENISSYLEKWASEVHQFKCCSEFCWKESYMACEINAEVSRSHSNKASSSSTTRTIGCFQTFGAIGPNACPQITISNITQYPQMPFSTVVYPTMT